MELAKSFDPHGIESRWYPFWESRGFFSAGFDFARRIGFIHEGANYTGPKKGTDLFIVDDK